MSALRLGDFLLHLHFRRPCEKRVIVEFMNGVSVEQIAIKFEISADTCRTYMTNVYREHDVSGYLALLDKALRAFCREHNECLAPLMGIIEKLREELD